MQKLSPVAIITAMPTIIPVRIRILSGPVRHSPRILFEIRRIPPLRHGHNNITSITTTFQTYFYPDLSNGTRILPPLDY